MKINLLLPLFLVILATTAIAASLDTTISPETAAPGSDLKLTIKTIDVPNAKWFVAFDVTLGGGCIRKENSQTTINDFILDEVSADQTKEYNIKAPSTETSCTFDIVYQFTDGAEETIQLTAAVKTPEVTPPPEEAPPTEPEEPTGEIISEGKLNPGWIIVAVIVIVGLIIYFAATKKKKVKAK